MQPETPPLLLPAPPLLLPPLVVPPLLLPVPELLPPPLLLPSVRPPSAVQTLLMQLPVQQSTSEAQLVPSPAPGLVGSQLWQFAEMLQPVGQAMSPQLPPVPPEPPLLQAAARTPDRMARRIGRAELRIFDLRASSTPKAGAT